MEKLYTRKEAAAILGITAERLDEARRGNRITYIQYVENGKVLFTEEALK
ncbi:MAG: DNA-binding protein, partial [Clostridia bacterium]|nr:DNA-binding protein [Clostridia bacterium]